MNAPYLKDATGKILPAAWHVLKQIIHVFVLIIITIICCFKEVNAQTLPGGFSQVLVTNGITNPTTMAFAPDGRIFVAEQAGKLRVIKNGAMLTQPFLTVSVNSSGERGLLGVAFDPAFATNKYIYIFYTLSSGARNRISRFTANGDVAVAGSEVIILDLDPLSSATNHNGGNMQFGPDGKLYIGTGENANTDWAQDLNSYHGKILRINADGSVPAGNPYTTGSSQKLRVWSYGLRNPFTLSIQPGTGRLFVNDVGQVDWEEINEATTSGKNFGWAWTEGNTTNPLYTSPIYTYQHREAGSGSGCAITGGTFFNPSSTNYPAAYMGKYFYMDYCGNWINMLTLSGTTATSTTFASNIAGSPVAILTGTDGNLYFLSRNNNALYKITYSGSSAPVITTQPQSISVAQGNTANFSVTVTGSSPLSYQWKKSGTNISGATNSTYSIASTVTSNAGTYSVTVTNAAGTVTSSNATLTVTSPNVAPTANITSPVAGYTYAGGQLINYAGTGTDPENGTLAASAFKWYILFYHDTHNHPGPTAVSGVKNGSFTIPSTGETASNVWYRLFLVVTDSQGATDTAYTDILPRTSLITINSSPQGLAITLDGQPFTTAFTVTSVEGITRSVSATSPQTLNGNSHNFINWSHGGTQTQTFATPVNDVTYTANYAVATNTPYGGTPRIIPGTIQVEDFDNGGQNLAYYDSSPENTGGAYRINESIDLQNSTEAGFNIGWTEPGEWIKYTVNVSTTGVYTLGARVSSQNSSSSFRVEIDGVIISTISVPQTGGYQSWQTVSKPEIYLTAGIKVMKIYFITGGFNLNYLTFTTTTVSNYPPVAIAGSDQVITLPVSSVNLSGSGTDSDGTIGSYSWTKISGNTAIISNPNAAFIAVTGLTAGIYKFELKVTDNNGATGRDTAQVTVNAAGNISPTVNAGLDQTITLPSASVNLSGSGADTDGLVSSFFWSKIAGPSSFIITNPLGAITSVNSLVAGVYKFEFKVTDNNGSIGRDTVQVTVNAAGNFAPKANAGLDQTILSQTASVNLAGTGTDSDGAVSSYLWSKIAGPSGFNITNPLGANTIVNSLVAGVYKFELKVTDNNGATGRDTVQVTVIVIAVGPLSVQVNIYGNNIYNNTQWNNWKPVADIASSNFLYTNGTQSTINASLNKQTAISDNGTSYAPNATACPPAVLQYYSTSSSSRNLVLKGMNPSKLYTLKFYAGSTIAPNGTTYYISGYGSDDIMTDNNINNIGQVLNVKPNSSGIVTVNLVSIYTHNFIAGFSIIEQTEPVTSRMSIANTATEQSIEPASNTNVYPNPFSGNLQVKLNSTVAGTYLLKLVDIKGKIVSYKPIIKNEAPTVEVINTRRFAPGIYYLEISGPGEKRSVHKLIKN
ncbi:MAG: PQQ-dependent sugar dehydrogenase [Ferruginibacter sp.]|nr:PQQ-dependent sugar dehydrogenase [Ferruginibacter sp.]